MANSAVFRGDEEGPEFTNKLNQRAADARDKGFFPTSAALIAAIPVGTAGSYAHVSATNTVWHWNGSLWVDSGVAPNTNTLNLVYPIGAIYMSVVSTIPDTLFGGTWAVIGEGRVLVGYNNEDADFDTAEETGGAKTHTLTESEMPVHDHVYSNGNVYSGGAASGDLNRFSGEKTSGAGVTGIAAPTINDAGGGVPHNNLQPYFVVYMWKRVT